MRLRDIGLEGHFGMIQVYTGNGKGKTTAAIGLAVRASGAGLKVYMAQFVKGRLYSEHKTLSGIKNIKVEQFGRSCFIKRKPCREDEILAAKGLDRVKRAVLCGKYRVIILDEINIALKLKLVCLDDLIGIIRQAPRDMEFIFTGRCAPLRLLKCADLVSQIKEVKHYYNKGVKARKGIEL